MTKDEFVAMMTADLPEAPAYFPRDAEINRSGARDLSELSPPLALTAEQVAKLYLDGYVLLDVRSAADFGAGHVPTSINIGLGGQFAIWAGSLIPLTAAIVIIADTEAQIAESAIRLARVGIENVKGYLSGGIEAWCQAGFELRTIRQVTVDELNDQMTKAELQIIDVRRRPEYESGHVPLALHAPLSKLEQNIDKLLVDPLKLTAVICAGGYRSSAATSILEQHGFTNLLNVTGGTGAWISAGYEVEKC